MPAGQSWTAEEEALVEQLFDQGYGYHTIAKRLGRTEKAILIRVKRRRLGGMRGARGVMSASDVARLLGLRPDTGTVRRWIERGWLASRVVRRGKLRFYRISWEQLEAALRDPRTWVCWEPGAITDLGTRLWATELRANQPGWIPIGEAARQIGVCVSAVGYHCRKGAVEAVQWGNWHIREPAVEALRQRLQAPVLHLEEKRRAVRRSA